MNEATRIQIENMKGQTFGAEVEMNNITRDKAAQVAASYFGTNETEYIGGSYYTWKTKDEQGRTWSFQRDSSIAGPDSETRSCGNG